jgi:hypothetical protein
MAERDAVQADPKHYTVEAEDDRARVLRIRYGRVRGRLCTRTRAAW